MNKYTVSAAIINFYGSVVAMMILTGNTTSTDWGMFFGFLVFIPSIMAIIIVGLSLILD